MAMTSAQRNVVIAGFLGWTLDAFDYFILIFAAKSIASDFQVSRENVIFAVTLTLLARPLGAFVFGLLAEKYGRRPMLMLDVALFSVFELATAFAPNLTVLFVLRLLFGFAMGGEWGLGSSLTMEIIPEKSRGFVSGLLQEGYACGNLLAALLFWIFFDRIGWRGMFIVGFIPSLLVLYIRSTVPESPVWQHTQTRPAHERNPIAAMKGYWGRALFMIVLMTLFNCFSHGTQDLYPLFLQVEKGFGTDLTGRLSIIGPIGAIIGGLFFGALSERIGRKRAIVIAAVLSLPILKFWAFSDTPMMLGLGAFWLQVMVQGAWGVVPVHLNELSPDPVRATMPGLTYQIGNFISAGVPWVLTSLAEANNKQYGIDDGDVYCGRGDSARGRNGAGSRSERQAFRCHRANRRQHDELIVTIDVAATWRRRADPALCELFAFAFGAGMSGNRWLSFVIFAGAILSSPILAAEKSSADPTAEIVTLKKEIAELKKSAYHPELGEQMLGIQIRHARLWFAGEAQNWNLAAFELQELKEAFDAVVEQNPDHAIFQPQRLADILPAMTKGPITALRDSIDHSSKPKFEKAFDALSAGCTGCHHIAGNDFLVIQRPKTPILDNLQTGVAPGPKK